MDLRLRNLEQLDARAVPLPHGTEVVTRVDRIVGERRIPQGTVGRVASAVLREEEARPDSWNISTKHARVASCRRRRPTWTRSVNG